MNNFNKSYDYIKNDIIYVKNNFNIDLYKNYINRSNYYLKYDIDY